MAGAGGVKVEISFDDGALEPSPTWEDVTALKANLVAGYDFERGRAFELDYTDTGSYSITIKDPSGILDATNSFSPLAGLIEPDLQIRASIWNPVAAEWQVRMRGWIESYDYDLDPSQQIGYLKISCYDIFALLSLVEMFPGEFGDPPPATEAAGGEIFFDNADFKTRIDQVGANALGATAWDAFSVVFTGNVSLLEHVLSVGETPMAVIQAACDGEFPGVSNVYPDRYGRLAAHGRLAKFDPEGTSGDAGPDAWDWHDWKIGDDAAAAATPGIYARMAAPFSWNRGRDKIVNYASAWPKDIADTAKEAQTVKDTVSIGIRGFQPWSKENLLTERGILTGNSGADECKAFGQFYVNNYAEPRNRITALTLKTVRPSHPTAEQTWEMLSKVDIADRVNVTVGHAGGGGFNLEPFFVEGIRETASPATGEYAMVEQSFDVSPAAYFTGDLAGLDGG